MKEEVVSANHKYMILKHALREKNVANTCKLFGISRTTFYNWKRAYQKHGMVGLHAKEPKKPQMPNQVPSAIEQEILAYVARYPADGPKRIYYELKAEGIQLGESGIYNVLRRNHLSRREQRLEFSKNKALHFRMNEQQPRANSSIRNPQDVYPGHLILQRIAYMGRFEGIGKIYQYSLYDSDSKWCAVKLYNKKSDIDVWDVFELKLVYLIKMLHLNIDNLVTEKTKEFVPYFIDRNKENDIIKELQINHVFMEPGKESIFEEMGAFNEYLVQNFYNKIGTEVHFQSFAQVEHALHTFIRRYNFSTEIARGVHAGKTPANLVIERAALNGADFDTLPLWLMALVNPPDRGDHGE
jgi:transposase-like protein